MEQWKPYTRFFDEASMNSLLATFNRAEISYLVEHEKEILDPVYIGHSLDPLFVVNLHPSDFIKANGILEQEAESDFQHNQIPEYFRTMDQVELKAILQESDSWNCYDRKLATLLLNSASTPNQEAKKGLQPTELSIPLIILSYVLSFIAIVGLLIWYTLIFATKTDENGQNVPMFGKRTRMNAWIMGAIALCASINFILKRSA